ncbi:MAG: hypothetical protein ABH872_02075 [Candidatus Omnitrophota bacterium]
MKIDMRVSPHKKTYSNESGRDYVSLFQGRLLWAMKLIPSPISTKF